MNLKKKFMVFLAVGIMAFAASPLVMAATPKPADNVAQEEQIDTGASARANKKYLTKGGAAFWFVLLFVANGAFSFWVGNRFYRMSRKDNHIGAEIRALRRDIEDKMVKSVSGFSEQELDIKNLNENLAMNDEGIKPAEKPVTPLREVSAEEEERFRRWEEAQSKPKTSRTAPQSAVREELQDDLDSVKKIHKKNYQPRREREEAPAKEENLDETKVMKPMGEVKTKAKEILGDIFPFKED